MHDQLSVSPRPDVAYDLLAHPRRRQLLAHLRASERTDRVFLDTLAADLTAAGDVEPTPQDELAVELHHNHLPKLDAAGLIRYDPTIRMVEFAGRSECESKGPLDIAADDD